MAAATSLLLAAPSCVTRYAGTSRSISKELCSSSVQWKLVLRKISRSSAGENDRVSPSVVVPVHCRNGGGGGQRGWYFAARDRELEFGKFKGSLLGTMSSKYLKWMAKNMRGGPMSEWAEYAEEVLEDPYYKDRLEWEQVEKLMTMVHDIDKITGNRDVLAPARVYGWDLENDSGWRKVNFALLGTTRGGRIPRVREGPAVKPADSVEKKKRVRKQSVSIRTQPASLSTPEGASQGSLRDELARRREMRRDRLMANRSLRAADIEEQAKRVMNPFPGRDGLVSKVRSHDISE